LTPQDDPPLSLVKPIVTSAQVHCKLRRVKALSAKSHPAWGSHVVLPGPDDEHCPATRARFRGISADSFDGRGNYTLGLREQLVFPEIEYDKIDKLRGLEVTIVTSARNDDHGRQLLRLLGMPFKKEG
jgi:hypothetical protein